MVLYIVRFFNVLECCNYLMEVIFGILDIFCKFCVLEKRVGCWCIEGVYVYVYCGKGKDVMKVFGVEVLFSVGLDIFKWVYI